MKNVAFVLLLVAVIVTMDLLLFRDRPRERLLANIGVVVAFIIVYLVFLRR